MIKKESAVEGIPFSSSNYGIAIKNGSYYVVKDVYIENGK